MFSGRIHLAAWLLIGFLGAQARADGLQAGAAQADITPPVGGPMWGFFDRKNNPTTGIRDPLQARALVIAAGADRMALVSLDLGRGPTRDITASLRKRLKDAVGIEHIFLVGSHTHCGPVLERNDVPPERPYVKELENKLFDLVVAAAKALQPARLGIGTKQVSLNVNRHSKQPNAPWDRTMLVLRVEDARGVPIAHAINYAAHATILGSKEMRWSADWPGAMAALVEQETAVPCLFLQGAAGDLTINRALGNTPEIFGQLVAKEALSIIPKIRCEPAPAATLQFAEEDFTFASRRPRTGAAVGSVTSSFYEREFASGVRPHLSIALLNGRIGFVGVSGEFFCAHALHLRERARLDHLFFLGYCNDHQMYFPTIEAVAEGGYGTESSSAPSELGAGERVMDRALIDLNKMRASKPSRESLGKALTFHAPFEGQPDAEFALGDKRIFTASSFDRTDTKPGLHRADISIVKGQGKFGDALRFGKKDKAIVFFQGDKNMAFKPRNWSGTVSFWLRLDPDKDLEPGFADPIQITDKKWDDAAFFVDFTKDDKPRHFRLGIYSDTKVWNPKGADFDKLPTADKPFSNEVANPPFAADKWTHVVFTFSNLNSGKADGTGKLYLDGKPAAGIGRRPLTFTWDPKHAAIMLALSYIGLYDDLAIFNRALTDDEVLYLNQLNGGVATLHHK
jgi:neutral ceramidase